MVVGQIRTSWAAAAPSRGPACMMGAMEPFRAVVTTGIYCLPACRGRGPRPEHVRNFQLAAAAEAAGYRACLRCRPYRTDVPLTLAASEPVSRAVRLIVDGFLDTRTEGELGRRLGISDRHLRRLFQAELGLTPDQLARSARTHFARRLLDETDCEMDEVALAAGFGSVRQLNRSFQAIFRDTPASLRAKRRVHDRLVADGGLVLRLPFSPPLAWDAMLAYFAARAIAGVEHVTAGTYRRTVLVDGDAGVLELSRGGADHLILRAHLPHWGGLVRIAQRARRIFNLDANAAEADAQLAGDARLGPLLAARPGLRPPGTWDPFETGVRTIIGQQVTVAGAGTITARLVERLGTPVPGLAAMGLGHLFPSPATIADADVAGLGLTTGRARALQGFARAVADGRLPLDRGSSLDELVEGIAALPGLGPWTAQYIALRLGEPDAFPATDLGVRRAMGVPGAREAEVAARPWRPWRAHAAAHLWLAH